MTDLELARVTDRLLARLADYCYHPTAINYRKLIEAAYTARCQVQLVLVAAGLQSELPGPPPGVAGPLHRRMAGLPPEPTPEGGLTRRLKDSGAA